MNLDRISIGRHPPWGINVIIEIPQGRDPVKYGVDKESGALFVDRFLHTAMFYPANCGFIPLTLSEDGDPTDVMVVGRVPAAVGAVIRSQPIGVLLMEDESGPDEKLVAGPVDELHPYYSRIASYRELPEVLRDQIGHFFAQYKDLEKGRWIEVKRWGEAEEATKLIGEAIARAEQE